MRLSVASPIVALTAILLTARVPATRAQDPGETVPSLEALVGNSTAIAVVRVKSLRTNEAEQRILELQLELVDVLKRPPEMPKADGEEVSEKPTLSFSGDSARQLRFYHQGYWSIDLSSPINTTGFLPEAFEKHADILFFQGFQSPESGELHILAPVDGPVFLTDWTALSSSEAIRKKIQEFVEHYRGVAQLRLTLLDVRHFVAPLKWESLVQEDAALPARAFIVPTDALYEKMLLAQIKYPGLLHMSNRFYGCTLWKDNTPRIYPFDSPENRALLSELLKDPKIGQDQRKLLSKILTAWK